MKLAELKLLCMIKSIAIWGALESHPIKTHRYQSMIIFGAENNRGVPKMAL